MITQVTTSLYNQLIADFETRASLWPVAETGTLTELRREAFEQFKQLGFPSTKVEDWKYTNLASLLKEEFGIVAEGEISLAAIKEAVASASIASLDVYTIVLVNGKYVADCSDTIHGDDISVLPIASAYNRAAFKSHFGKYINVQKNHFAALNTALFTDGLFIEVKNKAIGDKPLHIIHVAASSTHLFVQPRHLFVIGAQAEVSIIETYVTVPGTAAVFMNNATEIVMNNNAHLQHYYIQTGDENTNHIHHTEIHQQASSVYNNYKASFPGTSLLRNNLNVVLDGENIESHLYGLYLSGGRQLVDNHTLVDHRQPHCQSNELYKGVMKDEATGVFNGKIFVRKPAQKTNAFQQNNNLVLSKKAVVDSKPQLEIFADDVKCSHGSTVGQFNENALFYLKSRGIGTEKAKSLLIQAFAFDVTEKIPLDAVKSHINHLIEEGLGS